jgi:RNA polymerase sigma-70 factor (ECF subfamily)
MLRDVEGQEPQEVCRLLEISEGNLRVLLHRARTKLRASLDAALAAGPAASPAVAGAARSGRL